MRWNDAKNRMDVLIQYSTPSVEPLANFFWRTGRSSIYDERNERGHRTTTGSDNFLCCSLAWPCVLLSCTHDLKRSVHSRVWSWKSEQPIRFGWLLASRLLEILRRSIHLSSYNSWWDVTSFFFADVDREQSSFPQQHLSAAIDQETRPPRRRPPPPSPPPVLGFFILGCRRMTDCRTENRSETLESPGPEGDLGIGLPLAAPWAAPARPPGSSRGRWVCASFPGGSCPIGRGRAGCLDQPPGWRRGRWPSCSERKQKDGKHLRSCAVVLCNAFRWHQKSGLQDSSNCKFLIFSWWIICKGRMWLCVFLHYVRCKCRFKNVSLLLVPVKDFSL